MTGLSIRHTITAVIALWTACCMSATAVDGRLSDTRQQAMIPEIRSIQLKVDGNDQALPVIELGGPSSLTLEFDELSTDRRYMRYELIHCTWDWRPDGLVDSEYLDGFNQADVEQYAFSQATLAHYVHYTITIPDGQMSPLISGNYLLRVYDEQDPDMTLLQARFYVTEQSMESSAAMTTRTDIDYNQSHQQLSIMVDTDKVPVRSPHTDLRVVVEQNGRPDNTVALSSPVRVQGQQAFYEHVPSLIFPAGNEYRRMECVSTRYLPMGVEQMVREGSVYHFYLYVDEPRAGQSYLYDQTQHGRFRIREYDSSESDTESEYVAVHFALAMPEIQGGDIFVDGDLFNRILGPESRMVYNRASGLYELTALLKQGAYNYQYLYVPHGSTKGVTATIEGDYCDTSNEYTVRVYTRLPGDRYDRLTSVSRIIQ